MAYRLQEVGLLVKLNPKEAMRIIVAAYAKTMSRTGRATENAAEQLGVGDGTLKRWVRALEEQGLPVRARIAKLRRAERRAS